VASGRAQPGEPPILFRAQSPIIHPDIFQIDGHYASGRLQPTS